MIAEASQLVITIQFTCDRSFSEDATYNDVIAGPLRVAGVTVDLFTALGKGSPGAIDLTVLRAKLNDQPALRVIVFAFGDYDTLQTTVQLHPALLRPLATGTIYLLVCHRSRRHPFAEVKNHDELLDWVGIDPDTLEPTGKLPTQFLAAVDKL
jgi:hypothetical protein